MISQITDQYYPLQRLFRFFLENLKKKVLDANKIYFI